MDSWRTKESYYRIFFIINQKMNAFKFLLMLKNLFFKKNSRHFLRDFVMKYQCGKNTTTCTARNAECFICDNFCTRNNTKCNLKFWESQKVHVESNLKWQEIQTKYIWDIYVDINVVKGCILYYLFVNTIFRNKRFALNKLFQ